MLGASRAGQRDGAWLAAVCARIFLATGLPALVALCFAIAPFGVPDEPAHLLRATAISYGGIVPLVDRGPSPIPGVVGSAGGLVDRGVERLALGLDWQRFWTGNGVPSVAMMRQVGHVPAVGGLVYAAHSNTAIYLPLLYAGAATGTLTARVFRLPVLDWLYAGRLVNALLAAMICWLAIRRAGIAAPFLLAAAMLPAVLFECASVSADAMLLPTVLLFSALTARMAFGEPMERSDTILLALATIMVGAGKVAYMPLAALPPLVAMITGGRRSRTVRTLTAASLLAVLLWALWSWIVHDKIYSIRADIVVDPARQLAQMLAHPVAALGLMVRSMAVMFLPETRGIVGRTLGWYDLGVSRPVYYLALAALLATAFLVPRGARPLVAAPIAAIALAIGCYAAIDLLLYLQFNPVGAPIIFGTQGRYLTPLLVVVLSLVPRLSIGRHNERAYVGALAVWSVVSVVATLDTVLWRYWL